VGAGDALEGAQTPGLVQGAVAGHPGALAGHLLLLARLVLNTPGLVCPGPVLLTHGHVVTAKSADHQTRLPWIGLRAVASKAWTRDQRSAVPASSTAFVVGNLLASSVPVISVALSSSTSSLHSINENKADCRCQDYPGYKRHDWCGDHRQARLESEM